MVDQDTRREAEVRLRRKVKLSGPPKSIVLKEMEKAIQRTVVQMGGQAVQDDLAALTKAYRDFQERPQPETVEALEKVTHKMRGYAATAGYRALGEVAGSLAEYTLDRPKNKPVHQDLVTQHFLAAKLVIDAGPRPNDVDQDVRTVVDALHRAVGHFLKR